MAKGKGAIQGWITKNGVHIPIYGHYSVRGGEEPKAKGSRFKSGKVTAKTVSKALKKEYDEDSKETWYEGKINGKDVRITQETAGSDKFWNVDIGKPGDRHKLLTDNNEPMSFKSLEDAHDEIAHELNSGDKPTNASKGKKERNVLGQEVDFAEVDRTAKEREKDFIVNTPIPEGKAWERAESKRKSMEAADEADAYDKQHKEGKYAEAIEYQKSGQLSKDLQTSNKALDEKWASGQGSSSSSFSPESSAQTINDMQRRRANGGGKDDDWKTAQSVLESAPAGTTMIQTGNRGVKFQYTKKEDGKWHSSAGEDYTQDSKTLSMSWRGESGPSVEFTTPDKALSNADIKASHNAATGGRLNQALGIDRNNKPIGNRSVPKVDTSSTSTSTPDFSKMSYSEAGKYVSEHKKDFGLKAGDDAYQAAYEMKQGTWKQPQAATKQNKTVSTTESYPWTKSFGSSEPSASEYGKAMDSINERYDRETKTVPGREMGKVFEGLKPGDQIQIHNKWSTSPDSYTVNADGTIDYSTPSSSFLGKKGMSLAEAQKYATNDVDNRITVMRKKSQGNSTKQDSLSASMNERSRIRGELHAKDNAMKAAMPTTVSGLRSAYADATGSMKSKIAAELRRKGYSLVGGKWVKGRKE